VAVNHPDGGSSPPRGALQVIGQVAERLIALVLKISILWYHGFESHPAH
jgi:hypothetical protein